MNIDYIIMILLTLLAFLINLRVSYLRNEFETYKKVNELKQLKNVKTNT